MYHEGLGGVYILNYFIRVISGPYTADYAVWFCSSLKDVRKPIVLNLFFTWSLESCFFWLSYFIFLVYYWISVLPLYQFPPMKFIIYRLCVKLYHIILAMKLSWTETRLSIFVVVTIHSCSSIKLLKHYTRTCREIIKAIYI